MPDSKSSSQPFLIQIYFVSASLIGLVLLVIGAVTLVQLVVKQALGVRPYPNFSAPYPPITEPVLAQEFEKGEISDSLKVKLEAWQQAYDEWERENKDFDFEAEGRKQEIAMAVAMIVVGIPVFALHAPYVFKKRKN